MGRFGRCGVRRDAGRRGDDAGARLRRGWGLLIQRALAHRLLPLLYRALDTSSAGIPDSAVKKLEEKVAEIKKKNLRLTGELVRIMHAFREKDLRAAPYKGPILAHAVYGDIGLRQFDDLDILLAEDDVLEAGEILRSLGYEPEQKMTPGQEQAALGSECEFNFIHGPGGWKVELHWKVLPNCFRPAYRYEDIRFFAETGTDAGDFPSIIPEDVLIVMCMHSAFKHFYDNLSCLCDIADITCHPDINWDLLFTRAETFGVRRALLLGCYLVHRLLKTELPPHVLHSAASDGAVVNAGKYIEVQLFKDPPDVPGIFRKALFHLRMMDRFSRRLHYCRELLFRPSVYDRTFIRLPDRLCFLYYVVRPLRLFGKGLRRLIRSGLKSPRMSPRPSS